MTKRKLDDEAMATLVGCNRSTISRIRRGKTKPSWEQAARIKDVTQGLVPADSFLEAAE